MENLEKNNFTVLEGGLKNLKKSFYRALSTDTRLMGVTAVHAVWKIEEESEYKEFHQFFYFDSEEYGFDTYESIYSRGNSDKVANQNIIAMIEKMMGGLGAQMVDITEKELIHLVKHYAKFSEDMGDYLPGNRNEYEFLLNKKDDFTDSDLEKLYSKICVKPRSDYEAINYFIMRVTGRDFSPAKYLTKGIFSIDQFRNRDRASLLRNVIEESINESGTNTVINQEEDGSFKVRTSYFLQSLIDEDEIYYIRTSEISLEDMKVVSYKKISEFEVTASEVDMMTKRGEFITVFDLTVDSKNFNRLSTKITRKTMENSHEKGRSFMSFYPHNDHVNQKVFRLSDDVFGVLFISDYNQIILMSYEDKNLKALEGDLILSPFGKYVKPLRKYYFDKPVFYDFIESDFEDFNEYIDLITEKD